MAEPEHTSADDDARFMAAAIRLGRREIGRTWPNPAVGCLIVAEQYGLPVIVGRGWTRQGGRPHAETIAVEEAGAAARGATAYVSLEPCAHHGNTPPCADALVAAGISRVVGGLEDPDVRVSGRGYGRLREAGVEVVTGAGADAAWVANAGHFTRVLHGRPWVTLKLALSGDGRIAGPDRQPVAITGRDARALAHMLRATNDAILVGIGTAMADDPELTCRLPGMEDRSPVRVVLDSTLRLEPESRLLRTCDVAPVWIITTNEAQARRCNRLQSAGATIIRVAAGKAGRVDIASALSAMAANGITRLLVEGGAETAGSFVAADLVDEAVIFQSELPIGAGGLDAIAGGGLAALTAGKAYSRVDDRAVGADRMTSYLRIRQQECSPAS